MPFLKFQTNCAVSEAQETELKRRFGEAIALVPGKSEDYLLFRLEDSCRLWLRGENAAPMVYLEAAIFGNEGHGGYPAFTREAAKIAQEVLQVEPEHFYIKFEDITAWAVGVQYIDRRMFR